MPDRRRLTALVAVPVLLATLTGCAGPEGPDRAPVPYAPAGAGSASPTVKPGVPGAPAKPAPNPKPNIGKDAAWCPPILAFLAQSNSTQSSRAGNVSDPAVRAALEQNAAAAQAAAFTPGLPGDVRQYLLDLAAVTRRVVTSDGRLSDEDTAASQRLLEQFPAAYATIRSSCPRTAPAV